MKRVLILIFLVFSDTAYSAELKFTKVIDGLARPWALTFLRTDKVLITEKGGWSNLTLNTEPANLVIVDLKNKSSKKIKHNLSVLSEGQGGLLDVIYRNNQIWLSYSEIRGSLSSTSIAVGDFNEKKVVLKTIFRAEPPIASGYHFGSRLAIKGNYLFASLGERNRGMIAQDPSKHPGSIIRIHLDGSVPSDNPHFDGKLDWLPEIFQIGVRNPQGMCLSPIDNEIYISNHGAKGGDWFGKVVRGGNYGWKILGWGGTNYTGSEIGPKWAPGFTKALHYWTPSIAVSSIIIYAGAEFKEWAGDALVTSLKDKTLRRLVIRRGAITDEEVIFKGTIGRIRDIEVQKTTGKIFFLTDKGELWKLENKGNDG